jgi:hypothetical protein
MVLVSDHNDISTPCKGDFFSLPWSFLPMEGMKQLSLTNNGLDNNPVLSYSLAQLCHHKVSQGLLANLPPEGGERQIWSLWCRSELFHVIAIHHLGLDAQPLADSTLHLPQVEQSSPPFAVDTSQPESTPSPRVNL